MIGFSDFCMTRLNMKPVTKVGAYEMYAIETGTFGLDGGAMFGIVPKPLWQKKLPQMSKTVFRLRLVPCCFGGAGRNILVEVGNGQKWQDKEKRIYAIEFETNELIRSLSKIGLKPEDIHEVVITHLHFDHAGGATKYAEDGQTILPTFPNARYHVQETNWKHAKNPTLRDQGSYREIDF